LDVAIIQQREGRWVLADLVGKGRRIRTVAVPIWVMKGINVWRNAAGIEDGPLLRFISKGGKIGDQQSRNTVVEVRKVITTVGKYQKSMGPGGS
jgi:hypothetical protein